MNKKYVAIILSISIGAHLINLNKNVVEKEVKISEVKKLMKAKKIRY